VSSEAYGRGAGGSADHPATDQDDAPDAEPAVASIRWMSTRAAASYLGVTLRTLYRFIDEGDLPAYRFGRVIRLRQDEVDAFIAASRIPAGSLEHLYPELVGGSRSRNGGAPQSQPRERPSGPMTDHG